MFNKCNSNKSRSFFVYESICNHSWPYEVAIRFVCASNFYSFKIALFSVFFSVRLARRDENENVVAPRPSHRCVDKWLRNSSARAPPLRRSYGRSHDVFSSVAGMKISEVARHMSINVGDVHLRRNRVRCKGEVKKKKYSQQKRMASRHTIESCRHQPVDIKRTHSHEQLSLPSMKTVTGSETTLNRSDFCFWRN